MPYATNAELPEAVRRLYSVRCQSIFREVFNAEMARQADEGRAMAIGHTAAHNCMGARAMTEPVKFVKGSDTLVEGLAMPYFGPFKSADGVGRDLEGEFFSPATDFAFEMFEGRRPLLYQHGLDAAVQREVIGRVADHKAVDKGVWAQAQLARRSEWYEAVRALIEDDEALGFSSGTLSYLAMVDGKSGEILRWPWIELSLTPTPANPYAVAGAVKSLAEVARLFTPEPPLTVDPETKTMRVATFRAAWSAQYISDLPDGAFACRDSAGRHYPHHDAGGQLDLPHLRNALARLNQPGNVQCGRAHLESHARAAGIGERD